MRSTRRRRNLANAILASAAGLAVAGGCSTAMVQAVAVANQSPDPSSQAAASSVPETDSAHPDQANTRAGPETQTKTGGFFGQPRPKRAPVEAAAQQAAASKLPHGVSTATSFWDPETASGRPMAFRTLASPYWPLGTKVLITYEGKSTVGTVDDFGPAEWAVAQHDPPALIDLSEKMMQSFTGARENSVTVKFQVLKMGSGPSYRHSGTGYDTAMGH
jgi:hypothetical protein